MKKITERIKKKVEKLEHSYKKNELKEMEGLVMGFEKDALDISGNLMEINNLIDLIDKHEINAKEYQAREENNSIEIWVKEIHHEIKEAYLKRKDELLPEDIKFLEEEKGKLEIDKRRLERDQKFIMSLLAKSKIQLMEARETVCKEITNGKGIDSVGNKLVDNFGRKIELTVYEVGRRDILKFIEKTYSINLINAHKVFDILEKSGIVKFEIDPSSLVMQQMEYDAYMEMEYTPVMGNWHINA